ncbi:MAG: hypothetical protein H6736_14380 [Alphaproteobacteria bacterium]|nr:hypothetical protein [Alphaproteobacteria bacterium]
MADLVTHVCSGLVPAALVWPRAVVPLAIGTVLPDLSGRVPQMALVALDLDVVLPGRVLWMLDVAHTPVAQALLVGLLAQAFRDRGRVAGWMLVGVALHFALDVLQDHHGNGYYLLFPASVERWELGWIGSEATVAWAPWALLFTVLAWGARLAWSRRRGESPPGPVGRGEPTPGGAASDG